MSWARWSSRSSLSTWTASWTSTCSRRFLSLLRMTSCGRSRSWRPPARARRPARRSASRPAVAAEPGAAPILSPSAPPSFLRDRDATAVRAQSRRSSLDHLSQLRQRARLQRGRGPACAAENGRDLVDRPSCSSGGRRPRVHAPRARAARRPARARRATRCCGTSARACRNSSRRRRCHECAALTTLRRRYASGASKCRSRGPTGETS